MVKKAGGGDTGSTNASGKTFFGGDPAVFREYSSRKGLYFQVDRAALIPGKTIPFSLFLLDRFDISPLVMVSGDLPARIDDTLLSARGDILIRESDVPGYGEYLESLAASSGRDGGRIKAIALKEHAKIAMRGLFGEPGSREKIRQVKSTVNTIIDFVLGNREAVHDMLSMKTYDLYTYTHSVNVAVLAIGLGASISLKRDSIEKLGLGAMLHDIGKSAVPHEILNRQGRLSDMEYRVIKNHVVEGEKLLREHRDVHPDCLAAILQHHEKLSGKGYPFRLAGDNLKIFGRITALTDCYDALSTRRPFRPPFAPFYALSIIAKEPGDHDPDLLKSFVRMLGG